MPGAGALPRPLQAQCLSMGVAKQLLGTLPGRPAWRLLVICGLCLAITPHETTADGAWRARVSAKLQSVYDTRSRDAATVRFDSQGRVETDVHFNCALHTPAAALAAAGLSVRSSTKLGPLCVVEGWVAPAALPQLAAVPGVTLVKVPSYVRHIDRPTAKADVRAQAAAAGGIDGNAVKIMRADQFVAQAGGGGAGVTVAVQSQGVASLNVIQGRGELPNVQVLTSAAGGSNSAFADEGTVLLEEIHAVAPNAGLAFCEPQTFVQYMACLQQFVAAGASVVVDDLLFFDQDPMSTSGADTQGVSQFLTQNPGVAMFTAAGNDNGSYWEGVYTPVSVASQSLVPLSCQASGNPQVDNYVNQFSATANQTLTITPSSGILVPLTIAWSDPPTQNLSNFEIYWNNVDDPGHSGCFSTSTSPDPAVTQNIAVYPGTNIVYVATPDASLAGKFLKLWLGGDGLTALSVSTPGSVVSPQAFAPGVISVGAVNGSDGVGTNIERFSSRGPISIAFPSPAQIQAPLLTAPDGIFVDAAGTNFSGSLFPDGNFYGTSASAPNAAAIAALIRGAFPNLTVPQMLSALQSGAAQLGSTVPDGTFGYGRVDAMGALATLAAPTMTALSDVAIDASVSTTSSSVSFTVSGTGKLHFSVNSTNTALVPALVGAAPGVTVSPADCGGATLTCTLAVTAAQYQGGTTSLTISAVDGAGRAAPATMKVTVMNPQTAPPPPPVVVTGSNGGGGGGAFDWLALAILGLVTALRGCLCGAAGNHGRQHGLRVIHQ